MVSIKNIETESSHSHQNQIFFGGKLVPPSKQVSLLIYSPWAPTFQSWRDEPQHPVQVLSCHFCHARVLCSGYHDLLSLGRWGEYLHFHHDCKGNTKKFPSCQQVPFLVFPFSTNSPIFPWRIRSSMLTILACWSLGVRVQKLLHCSHKLEMQ